MKYRIALLLIGFFSISGFGQEKVISSKIEKVTVFYQGAQINRISQELPLAKGQTVLIVNGLERSLQENSLRVGVKGNAKILNVVKSMDFLNEAASSEKIEELKEELLLINEKAEDQRLTIKVYEQERNLLTSNMKLGGANSGVTVSQIKEAAAFYRLRLSEIEQTILDTNRQIKKLEEKNRKIQAQLNELNYKKNVPTSRLELTMETESPSSVSLLLDYMVNEAGWTPSYDIRIDEVGDPVQLVRKASVRQSTGEDWRNILLSFSTGNPTEQQIMPQLSPWYVNFSYPQSNEMMIRGVSSKKSESAPRAARSMEMTMVADEEESLDEYDMFASAPSFETASKNSILEFKLTTKASISSDGKEYAFSIGNEELLAEYHYQAVPKKEKAAFLVATMTNWEEYELVDGKANIYYEKMFIGETFLSTSMMLDSMQLSMGKDKGIIVDRIIVKDFSRARTIGSNIKKSFGYELEVRNTKATAAKLILEDQIPLSSNSQILVEAEELSGGELNEVSGKVIWRLSLEPGETIKLPFKYSIKYPKGQAIVL